MTDKMIEAIKYRVMTFFHYAADLREAGVLCSRILDDVIKDIEETADEDFNNSDIDIAITRVLMNKL